MELSEIRSFLTIAELGNFSRASLRLGVPQPTLSRQLSRLERDLGTPLFYRHGRGASLTDTGRQFREAVEPLVRDLDRLRSEIMAQVGREGGTVRLGLPQSVSCSIAAAIVAGFDRQCRPARLQLVEANSGTLSEWLAAGIVDVAVLYDCHKIPHMSVEPVFREELFLIVAARPGIETGPVSIEEIDREKLILPTDGQGPRRAIDAAFEEAGRPLAAAMEIDAIAATKELIEDGGFMGLLPLGAVHREVLAGRLVARPVAGAVPLVADLVLGTALSQPVTPAARQLLRIINAEVAAFVERGLLRGHPRRSGHVPPVAEAPPRMRA